MTTLQTIDTEFTADSCEVCPRYPCDVLAVGTYQLRQGEEGVKNSRVGRIYLYSMSDKELKEEQRLETSAVLDMKWGAWKPSHDCGCDDSILAVATSTGQVHFYEVHGVQLDPPRLDLQTSYTLENQNILCLSLDWSNRICRGDPEIAVSLSDGGIVLLRAGEGEVKEVAFWTAHVHEAWIAGCDSWHPTTLFTGGDDGFMRIWDTRQMIGIREREPAAVASGAVVTKRHDAGVTTVQAHALREHIVATGSYDEIVRIWDVRKLTRPTIKIPVGGGVWRLKWHPTDPRRLLVAGMYSGFHILDVGASYTKHDSIAYGVDWARGGSHVASCSFYDHALHYWMPNA